MQAFDLLPYMIQAGAVPVYLGAPNWREFVPMNHSVIDASEFDSPEELASFLRELAQDDERYLEYHKWREQPLPSEVEALESTSFHWNLCRVCRCEMMCCVLSSFVLT